MAASERYFVFLLLNFFLLSVCCLPEPGKKDLHFDKNRTYGGFSKTMSKGYTVAIKGKCSGASKVQINWRLVVSECAEQFSFSKDTDDSLRSLRYSFVNHSLTGIQQVTCGSVIHLQDLSNQKEIIVFPQPVPEESKPGDDAKKSKPAKATSNKPVLSAGDDTKKQASTSPKQSPTPTSGAAVEEKKPSLKIVLPQKPKLKAPVLDARRKRDTDPDEDNNDDETEIEEAGEPSTAVTTDAEEPSKAASKVKDPTKKKTEKKKSEKKKSSSDDEKANNQVCVTKHDGVFLLIVNAFPVDEKKTSDEEKPTEKEFQLTLNVEMKAKRGYLSASDWPLYPFYGSMSLLYVFYGIVWLVVSACQWRDLLRIQFWIGGVIALGMLEKAVFFSEYNNINITGETSPGLTIFAELVSCVKRTLARILVIIVSMGFGIVKPRLGTTLHRVLGVGALYFILATVEGCFRALHPKSDPGRQQLIASIPLAVLDASICWWIFMSLVQTTRTLRIRRNLVKLSLYRHFTNTLIFAVLASVAYMIWSIKTHRFAKDNCITDWSELWLDEAFWHFLFSIVLLVIMVLWRPTANNQRYAFTPIVDFGDDDDDDDNMTLSDAFDGMKMRNVKNIPEVVINGDHKRKLRPEDDLKWVEENIPSSAADAVLPSVLDSDEELMTTKFEMSKME